MKVDTKLFGKIEVQEDKLLKFDLGVIGFDKLKNFLLIHEPDKEQQSILWMQSIDEPDFAFPVINPLNVISDYNPIIEDELLNPLGDINEDNTLVLVTLTVPGDIAKMSVNLKAPIIINASARKACQIIVDNDSYLVKYPVYDILKSNNQKDGE